MPLPVITTVPQHIQDQWLFTDAELDATPAILQGMPIAEERARRAKGVNFITQAGIMLKLPQVTLGTASMFLHRIFMRISMDEAKGGIHHYNIAATALFLATKSEENCRKTKDIVIAVAKVAGKNPLLIIDEQSKEFWRWKDSILLYEEMMLELLTFDVVLDSPYTHLYHLLRRLNLEERKELRNVAWAFVNDSQLTTLGLMVPARDVATGAVFFAAKYTGNTIDDAEDGRAWWKVVGGDEQKIIRAVTVLHEFYTDNPLKKSDSPHEGSPPRNPDDLNTTRRKRVRGENGADGGSQKGEDDMMDGATDGKSHTKEASDESAESMTIKGGDMEPHPSHSKQNSDVSQTDKTSPQSHIKESSDETNTIGYQTAWTHANEECTESTHTHNKMEEGEVRGDDDEKLKEAANDPATHQQKGRVNEDAVANGVGDMHIAQQASELNGSGFNEGGLKAPPIGESGHGNGNLSVKRKAEDDVDMDGGEEAKRPKTGVSEEGELE